ncbi:hypothetical protein CK203_112029 [Vitis vinifera]|uniref:Retrotransposon gag domain-containing protein n=1 Tax=Vitis vinifera TaxID=29760 RepID=A0A438CAF5_VITVI|nr:hypothetical protein CK203_112029 [Vitis vinifera]
MASIQEALASLGQRIDGHQTEVAPPPVTLPIPTSDEPYTCMDRLDQRLRQMRASDGVITWEDFDGALVVNLPAKFRMPEIERYTDVSRRRTWDDIIQEFLRQFAFNTIIGVSRRDLEALRQRLEKSITSLISHWREKISQIIDRPSENDQINMILRILQPRFARHLMGFPHTDFGSLEKKPSGGQRSGDVGAICSAGMRPPRHYQTIGQTFGFYYPPSPYVQYRPPSPFRPMTPTYLHLVSQLVFAAHATKIPPAPYTRHRAPQTTTYV